MNKYTQPLANLVVPKGLQTGPFGSQLKAEEYTHNGIPVVMPKDIYGGKIKTESIARTSVEKSKSLQKHFLQEGDILFPRRGNLGRIAVASKNNEGWICGTGCLRARLKSDISSGYIHQFVQMPQVVKWLENNALGQTMLNLNTSIIGKLPVYAPPLDVQKNIAEALQAWDKAIEKTEALIVAKEKQFDWLCSSLINCAGHKRLATSKLIGEVSKRNKDRNIERVLSVTNHSGFVLPEDQFERRVASADVSNYKVVEKGQYAYNPSRINVGSIARLDDWENGILSPMYVVFKIDNIKVCSDYFLHWLNSNEARQRIKNSAQGSVRETVSFKDLGTIDIPLPVMSVQKDVAYKLNLAKREISLLKQMLEQYRDQKCGLMQKLLTGEWQINTQPPLAKEMCDEESV
ncbi:restriction endonuclease subunit S [Acinetobacter sp. AM]|uniref:restriction endonuclease subunit S n=1 Tax=Acinetobacter sp. AM TaxID=2170730 RepID=UPI000DE5FB26|nr:restriction endonuclease subunit S [Acinetobacter sp. AM]PWB14344.1 restriction endonuclease subunit S [Acinetobacter sp. AM]